MTVYYRTQGEAVYNLCNSNIIGCKISLWLGMRVHMGVGIGAVQWGLGKEMGVKINMGAILEV